MPCERRVLMIRYAFKKERGQNDPIEIEDDDDFVEPSRKFYWNPYSGELSLTFPTSNTKSKGGILADAMGECHYSRGANKAVLTIQAWARPA